MSKILFLSECSLLLYNKNIDSYVLRRNIRFEEQGLEYEEVLKSIYKDLEELNYYTDSNFDSDFQMLLAYKKCAFEILPKDYPILYDYYVMKWYNNLVNELEKDLTLTKKYSL